MQIGTARWDKISPIMTFAQIFHDGGGFKNQFPVIFNHWRLAQWMDL